MGTEAHSFKTSRHETAEEQERHLLPSCKLGAVQAAPQAGDPSWTSTMAAQTCSSPPPPRQRRESGRLPHRTETSLRPVAITASSSTTRTEYPKRSHHRPACTSARIMAETSAWKKPGRPRRPWSRDGKASHEHLAPRIVDRKRVIAEPFRRCLFACWAPPSAPRPLFSLPQLRHVGSFAKREAAAKTAARSITTPIRRGCYFFRWSPGVCF